MERRIEAVDMMAAVGVFATIVGGAFLFMATDAEWTSKLSDTTTEQMASFGGSTTAMQWVQPALGEALVQNICWTVPRSSICRRPPKNSTTSPL